MKFQKALILFSLIFIFSTSFSQSIKGEITNKNNGVPYAVVILKGTNYVVQSDENGFFEFKNIPYGNYLLLVKSAGFKSFQKSILVDNSALRLEIILDEDKSLLDEVVVTGTMEATHIKESPVKVEVLTSEFLKTNPTNNLMEAIATVNGVQECVSCGVCGTNDIHINGMEGSYSMIMIDGMPIMGSLASVYGLNGIPTEMIEQIEVIKGPSSTLYGTEAVSGVINVITKQPKDLPLISLNIFGTTHQEKNIDFAITPKMGKISTLIGGNYFHMDNFIDANGDDFSDVPLNHRISLFNKWSLKRKDNRVFSISGKYYYEDRFGGTSAWTPELRGSSEVYGESIYTDRKELIGSYQLPFKEKIKLDFSHSVHDQNSVYGDTKYKAYQEVSFVNLYWSKKIGVRNNITSGITARNQVYDDNTVATLNKDSKLTPGIFTQHEYKFKDNLKTLTGLRWDIHQTHGNIFSPRLSLKYNPATYTTFRINSGTGFKVVNLFTEDHAAYTGTRDVVVIEELNPETSYNVTFNANHVASALGGNTTLDLDLFYSYFTNKIIPDYETDRSKIIYENLNGYSITKGISIMVNQSFNNPFKVSLGGTLLDAFEIESEERLPILFAPNFSGVFTVSYHFEKIKTNIDYSGNVIGKMHLPTYNSPFERPETSPWYSVQNMQLTKEVNKNFSFYISVKNLLNYTQSISPIVDFENPYSDNFDTSYAYGPLQQRRFLVGIRLKIK